MSKTSRTARDFENAVAEMFQIIFPRAQRTGLGFEGSDLRETDELAVECKAQIKLQLAEWMKQAVLQGLREKRAFPVIVHKRRRYNVRQSYVTMELRHFIGMIAWLKGIELTKEQHEKLGLAARDESWPDWAF